MTIDIVPIRPEHPDFAGLLSGISVAGGISREDATIIEEGMDHFAVLVLRDQQMTDDQQYAFSEHFGPPEQATGDLDKSATRRLSMKINDISNLDENGAVMAIDDRRYLFGLGNRLWHSDSSFKPTPAKYSLLSARHIPASGGNTEFADMRAAWDALPAELQAECMDKICDHSQLYSRGQLGFTEWTDDEIAFNKPVPQRLVRRHAGSGRLSLYLSAHAGAIHGLPMPEARIFLRELNEHATQKQFIYSHQWQPNDLVIWDNRAVMHRATRYDSKQVRDLHRTTVSDSAPTLQQPL
ncbi:MAG: TauD/TfdA family dioxygenase [Rhodospirillales bacterium]|nr:TauD/TfdA family dioxygenase [Rhodospirillales bacterium]